MRKLAILILVISGTLSGCIAYDGPYRDEPMHRQDREHDRDYDNHHRSDQDRDRDRDHDRDRDYDRH